MENTNETQSSQAFREKIGDDSLHRERKKEAWGQFLSSLQQQDFLKILKNLKRSEIYKTQTIMISDKEEILNIYESLLNSEGATDFLSENWSAQEIVFLLWIGYAFYIRNKNLNLYSLNFKIWDEIAKLFPTSKNCHQLSKKWKMIKINKSKKDFWTPEEDEALRDLIIKKNLKNKWTLVANMINTSGSKTQGNRTAKQCRERWINYLDPKLNKEPWTATEDIKLLNLTLEKKKRWIKISKCLEGRTENAVKNRFNSLMNKIKKAINTLSDMNKELPPENDPKYEKALISTLLKIKENDLKMSDAQSQADSMGSNSQTDVKGDEIFLKTVINTSLEEFLKIKKLPEQSSMNEKITKKIEVKIPVQDDMPKIKESHKDSIPHHHHGNYNSGEMSSDEQLSGNSQKGDHKHNMPPAGYILAGHPAAYLPIMSPRMPMNSTTPLIYPGYLPQGYPPYYIPAHNIPAHNIPAHNIPAHNIPAHNMQHTLKTEYVPPTNPSGYSPTSPHNSQGNGAANSVSTETPSMKHQYSNPSSPGFAPYYGYMPGMKNPCLIPADGGLLMPSFPINNSIPAMGYGMNPYTSPNYYSGLPLPHHQMYAGGAEHMEGFARGVYQMGGASPLSSNYFGADGKI